MLKLSPPKPILSCMEQLNCHGYSAYFVGGCVRDGLMGRAPSDWDICTSALPEQIAACFGSYKTILVGMRHGTVAVVTEDSTVEITTFRSDGEYTGHRKPKQVTFSPSLEEDLARRDFTVNAMAWHPDQGLVDPYGGCIDLEGKVIRCVGDPLVRFDEDALRILRMFRFSAQLGFSIDFQTLEGAQVQCALLAHLSGERIQAELNKILVSGPVRSTLELMADTGILSQIIPEFADCIGFEQNTPYHNRTVDRHTFQAVENAPPLLPVRLALLLHDIAKPACYWQDKQGVGHFTGHQKSSAEIAASILKRLRYDAHTQRLVIKLIELHDLRIGSDRVSVKQLLFEHGEDFLRQLIEVRLADTGAKNPALIEQRTETLLQARRTLQQVLDRGEPFCINDLAVSGNDLAGLGIAPGPLLGDLLQWLMAMVIVQPTLNTKEELLAHTRKYLEQQ